MTTSTKGEVQTVLIDPATYQQAEEELERARLIEAIRPGERNVAEGRTRPAADVFADLKARYGI